MALVMTVFMLRKVYKEYSICKEAVFITITYFLFINLFFISVQFNFNTEKIYNVLTYDELCA